MTEETKKIIKWSIACTSTLLALGYIYFSTFWPFTIDQRLGTVSEAYYYRMVIVALIAFSFSIAIISRKAVLIFLLTMVLGSVSTTPIFVGCSNNYASSIHYVSLFLISAFSLSFLLFEAYNRRWSRVVRLSVYIILVISYVFVTALLGAICIS